MPKTPSSKTTSKPSYDQLKAFYAAYMARFMPDALASPRINPLVHLESVENKSKALAAKALPMAINDCIEMSFNRSQAEVKEFDAELKARGIVTLSEIRWQFSRRYAAILKRGKIRNDEEFYLIRNVMDAEGIAADERASMMKLADEYEGV